MSEQLRRLSRGVDIVVGTPGRVLDHIRRGTMKLENVRYLVLDEADEMLNMGFVEDVEEIMSHTSDERRVLLFSATMPERIIRLSKTYMRDTEIVRVENMRTVKPNSCMTPTLQPKASPMSGFSSSSGVKRPWSEKIMMVQPSSK